MSRQSCANLEKIRNKILEKEKWDALWENFIRKTEERKRKSCQKNVEVDKSNEIEEDECDEIEALAEIEENDAISEMFKESSIT